jgi:hypothetical protein
MVDQADPVDHDETRGPAALRGAHRSGPRRELLAVLLGTLLLVVLLLAGGCVLAVLALRAWAGAT